MRFLNNCIQVELTPLHKAAAKNSSDVAELLIRSGADVNATGCVSTVLKLISDISLYRHYDYYLTLSNKAIVLEYYEMIKSVGDSPNLMNVS